VNPDNAINQWDMAHGYHLLGETLLKSNDRAEKGPVPLLPQPARSNWYSKAVKHQPSARGTGAFSAQASSG